MLPFVSHWLARRRGRQDGLRGEPSADARECHFLDAIRRKYETRILRIWRKWTERNRRLYDEWCQAIAPYRRQSEAAEAAWERIVARERLSTDAVVQHQLAGAPLDTSTTTEGATPPSGEPVVEEGARDEGEIQLLRQQRQHVMDELSATLQEGSQPIHPWQGLGSMLVVGILAFLADIGINSEAFQAGASQVQAYVFGFALAGVMLVFAHFLGKLLASTPRGRRRRLARRGWLAFLILTPLLLLAFVVGPRVEYGQRAGGIIGLGPLAGAIFLGVVNLAAYGIVAYVSYQYYDPELVERRLQTKRQWRLRRRLARLDRRIGSAERRRGRESRRDRRAVGREQRAVARQQREEVEDEARARRRRAAREARQRERQDRRQHRRDLGTVRRSEEMYARLDRIRVRRVAALDATRDRVGELLARCRQELAEYAHSNLRARSDGVPSSFERDELARIRVSTRRPLVPHYQLLTSWFEGAEVELAPGVAVGEGVEDPWRHPGREPILSWNCESGSPVGAEVEAEGDLAELAPTDIEPQPMPGPRGVDPPSTPSDEPAPAPSDGAPESRSEPPDWRRPFMPPPPPSKR